MNNLLSLFDEHQFEFSRKEFLENKYKWFVNDTCKILAKNYEDVEKIINLPTTTITTKPFERIKKLAALKEHIISINLEADLSKPVEVFIDNNYSNEVSTSSDIVNPKSTRILFINTDNIEFPESEPLVFKFLQTNCYTYNKIPWGKPIGYKNVQELFELVTDYYVPF